MAAPTSLNTGLFADALRWPDFCSDKFRQGWVEDKDNIGTVDDLLDAYIALYNDSISKVPADMHTGVHLCRGNVGLSFLFPSPCPRSRLLTVPF